MLTKTLSEAKKKQRSILIKAMNNDIGSIDSAKDSWNPAQISERAKDISYIRSLVDTWNPAQLNEALKMLDLPVIDTWNPAQIEEQRRNLVFYLAERTLTGNPINLKILGNLNSEVTGLKVTMNPIQDLNGYDHPWAGGMWKNKYPILVGNDAGINNNAGGTHSTGSNGELVVTTAEGSASGCYFVNSSTLRSLLSSMVPCYVSFDVVCSENAMVRIGDESSSSSLINVSTTKQRVVLEFATASSFVIYGNRNSVTITISDLMVSATSENQYYPYSNICPITGRDELSITRTSGEDEETKTHNYSDTIYGGVDDFVNGVLTNEWGYIAEYDGETLPGVWISDRDAYAPDTTPSTGAEVAYRLETPTTIETTPEEITLLKGTNVLSTDGDTIELKYKQNF